MICNEHVRGPRSPCTTSAKYCLRRALSENHLQPKIKFSGVQPNDRVAKLPGAFLGVLGVLGGSNNSQHVR
jgi:hypothetical protein